MHFIHKAILVGGLFCAVSHSDVLQIPYTSGKLSQSVVITLNNGSSISPDSIRVGTAFTVEAYLASNTLTVCSNRHELGLLLHVPSGGTTRRQATLDTNWMGYSSFPVLSSTTDLDSLPRMGQLGLGTGVKRARGYIFAHPGDDQCWTETYSFNAAFSQVVFVQSGSVYAKLKIVDFTQTLPGPPPPQWQPKTLNTITLRMVVNTNPDDLVDPNPPVALRRKVAYRNGGNEYSWKPVEYDLYSPLGVKLDRNNKRYYPAIPNSRSGRPVRQPAR